VCQNCGNFVSLALALSLSLALPLSLSLLLSHSLSCVRARSLPSSLLCMPRVYDKGVHRTPPPPPPPPHTHTQGVWDKGVYRDSFRFVAKNYLAGNFWFDFVTAFPVLIYVFPSFLFVDDFLLLMPMLNHQLYMSSDIQSVFLFFASQSLRVY
jgi:hypothetical protein